MRPLLCELWCSDWPSSPEQWQGSLQEAKRRAAYRISSEADKANISSNHQPWRHRSLEVCKPFCTHLQPSSTHHHPRFPVPRSVPRARMARKRQSRPSGGTAPTSRGSKRQRRRPAGGAGANAGAGAAGGGSEGATSDSGASSELRIHVMRHGNVHNPKEVYYGRLPRFHLSALGRKQAVEGAERLASVITDPSELQGVYVAHSHRVPQSRRPAPNPSRCAGQVCVPHAPSSPDSEGSGEATP